MMKILLPNILQLILEKIQTVPQQNTLKKALYGTLMAGFLSEKSVALQVVMSANSSQVMQSLLEDLGQIVGNK